MSKKTRRKKTRGRYPVVVGEETRRATVNLGVTLFELATQRAGEEGISAYLRRLVERDIREAVRPDYERAS
jgi:hypothetical protein